MRCFIAIPIPAPLRPKLVSVQRKLKGNLKLVEKDNFHINLKFLGDISESQVEEVKKIMDDVAASHNKINIQLHGLGAFPTHAKPRVVWAGVKGDFSIQKDLENELEKVGFPPESRKFKPHVTLARKRSGRVRMPEKVGFLGDFVADEISLIESDLRPTGPEYTTVYSAKLE